jgi:hypothetical protein
MRFSALRDMLGSPVKHQISERSGVRVQITHRNASARHDHVSIRMGRTGKPCLHLGLGQNILNGAVGSPDIRGVLQGNLEAARAASVSARI